MLVLRFLNRLWLGCLRAKELFDYVKYCALKGVPVELDKKQMAALVKQAESEKRSIEKKIAAKVKEIGKIPKSDAEALKNSDAALAELRKNHVQMTEIISILNGNKPDMLQQIAVQLTLKPVSSVSYAAGSARVEVKPTPTAVTTPSIVASEITTEPLRPIKKKKYKEGSPAANMLIEHFKQFDKGAIRGTHLQQKGRDYPGFGRTQSKGGCEQGSTGWIFKKFKNKR